MFILSSLDMSKPIVLRRSRNVIQFSLILDLKANFHTVLDSWGLPNIDRSMFRSIFVTTPFFAGGWNETNCWGVVESGLVRR
jgi:hypothetical protein